MRGGIDVLIADFLCLVPHGGGEGFTRGSAFFGGAAIQRIFEPLPVFFRKLHIDGQQHFALLVGNSDRELHTLPAPLFNRGIPDVLIGRKNLIELRAALGLSHAAPRSHVGEYSLQVANPYRQLFHLAKTGLDVLQPFGNQPEAFREPPLECGVQLLIHRRPHLFELRRIAFLQFFQPALDGLAQAFLTALVRFGQCTQLLGDFLQAVLHFLGELLRVFPKITAELTEGRLHGLLHLQGFAGLGGLTREQRLSYLH